MGARSDQMRNFCNNIKAYHEKREEEQFYDFTIKDKDGLGIQSHKFILASQSDYFAGLLRLDPTANETTFKDFSLDVIKNCIDYLYIHRVNLTCNNVQDVLEFADFINLQDVTDICTNYMINNIDQSNYALVIDLGNARGIDQLVEAGVFFVVRNLRQNIDRLDDFIKKNGYKSCPLVTTAFDDHDKGTMEHLSTKKQISVNARRRNGLAGSWIFSAL